MLVSFGMCEFVFPSSLQRGSLCTSLSISISYSNMSKDNTAADKPDFAVIRTGGKQYRVSAGDRIFVEKVKQESDSELSIGDVLLINQAGSTTVGTPQVEGASVTARILAETKGAKVINYKKKRRKGYHRKVGHRQQLTELEITAINS